VPWADERLPICFFPPILLVAERIPNLKQRRVFKRPVIDLHLKPMVDGVPGITSALHYILQFYEDITICHCFYASPLPNPALIEWEAAQKGALHRNQTLRKPRSVHVGGKKVAEQHLSYLWRNKGSKFKHYPKHSYDHFESLRCPWHLSGCELFKFVPIWLRGRKRVQARRNLATIVILQDPTERAQCSPLPVQRQTYLTSRDWLSE
jgi:hypothetical protein